MRRQAVNSHEQDTKYVVIIACILVMVVLLPLGYVRYKTRYETEQISTSMSPDGDYELVIYSVGEPDFPSGKILEQMSLSVQPNRNICAGFVDRCFALRQNLFFSCIYSVKNI